MRKGKSGFGRLCLLFGREKSEMVFSMTSLDLWNNSIRKLKQATRKTTVCHLLRSMESHEPQDHDMRSSISHSDQCIINCSKLDLQISRHMQQRKNGYQYRGFHMSHETLNTRFLIPRLWPCFKVNIPVDRPPYYFQEPGINSFSILAAVYPSDIYGCY